MISNSKFFMKVIASLIISVLISCKSPNENSKPVVEDQEIFTVVNVPVSGQIIADDSDGEVTDFKLSVLPLRGSIAIDSRSGSFVYTPQRDYSGSDSFQVVVKDNDGEYSVPSVVFILISTNA